MSKEENKVQSSITDWLVKMIKDDALLEHVNGLQRVKPDVYDEDCVSIPSEIRFGKIAHNAYRVSADYILAQIDYLDILFEDDACGDNLEIWSSIVCVNPSSRAFVVIILEGKGQETKNLASELMRHELSLRTKFSFLGSQDICFVLIAEHFPSTLENMILNLNTWYRKKCVGLKLSVTNAGYWLDVFQPGKVKVQPQKQFCDRLLRSFDIFLNPARHNHSEQNRIGKVDDRQINPPQIVFTAIDLITRTCDRQDKHGFVMLWRDTYEFRPGQLWLTVVMLDPLGRDPILNQHEQSSFDTELSEMRPRVRWESIPQTLFEPAIELLGQQFELEVCGESYWQERIDEIKARSVPLRFDFWGGIGDYARDVMSRKIVANVYKAVTLEKLTDWRNPLFAIPFLEHLHKAPVFPAKSIRCSNAFMVGKTFGEMYSAVNISSATKTKEREHHHLWKKMEIFRILAEMKILSMTNKRVSPKIPSFLEEPELTASSIKEIACWISDQFIGKQRPLHRECFVIGFDSGAISSDFLSTGTVTADSDCAAGLVFKIRQLWSRAMEYLEVNGTPTAMYEAEEYIRSYSNKTWKGCGSISKVIDSIPDRKLIEGLTADIVAFFDVFIPKHNFESRTRKA